MAYLSRALARVVVVPLVLACGVLAAACGSSGDDATSTTPSSFAPGQFDVKNWDSVLAAAKGQTVHWYMYGGSDKINAYVNGYVKDELAKAGVGLEQVKVTDTVEVINKVLGEKQAGRDTGGSVDVIWINGENFKTGRQADLWYCGYVRDLPNASFANFDDPSIVNDFGLPVDDCESPWARAQSVVVFDSAKVPAADLKTPASMMAFVKAHPGSFAYPAPPDFTGSMVVRTLFYNQAGGFKDVLGPFDRARYDSIAPGLWSTLNGLEPSLWRKGETYPKGQTDVGTLYANGEISMFLTYGSGGIGDDVAKGTYPATTREAVFDNGMLGNISFLSIPKNAGNIAAALVLANIELSPEAQLEKTKATGLYPAIDLAKAPNAAAFAALPTPESVLAFDQQVKNTNPETQAEWVTTLEQDWKTNVQEK